MYFLYNLIDPITNDIKYVGYTKNPKRRIWEHIRDAKKGIKTYKCEWIRSLLDKKNIPIMEIISEYESHNEIVDEEMKLIQEYWIQVNKPNRRW
jgi:predicted GIY-YIG superfamily endonuclease